MPTDANGCFDVLWRFYGPEKSLFEKNLGAARHQGNEVMCLDPRRVARQPFVTVAGPQKESRRLGRPLFRPRGPGRQGIELGSDRGRQGILSFLGYKVKISPNKRNAFVLPEHYTEGVKIFTFTAYRNNHSSKASISTGDFWR